LKPGSIGHGHLSVPRGRELFTGPPRHNFRATAWTSAMRFSRKQRTPAGKISAFTWLGKRMRAWGRTQFRRSGWPPAGGQATEHRIHAAAGPCNSMPCRINPAFLPGLLYCK
jgi:hypothetical protein